MWRKIILSTWLFLLFSLRSEGQVLTYQFVDPCTKQITFFSVPATGTTVFFLGQSRQFTASDVLSGAFSSWINQVYADYRKVTPCSQQSGQVTQNQIVSQAISGTVQSVVGSIMSQAQSASSTTSTSVSGATDAASKGSNSSSENKTKQNANSNTGNNTIGSGNTQGSAGTTSGSGNNTGAVSGGSGGSGNSGGAAGSNSDNKNTEKGEEVAATTTMNSDSKQEKGESGGGSKSGKGGKSGNARSNPVIVQSDLTTAQNLDRSFTPILNLGISRSSMTGASSWGLTSMTWLNFKQFALSGRFTKMHYSKSGSLKYIHNLSLTGVYTYGNVLAFFGYSGILNAGKWGVTGFNLSAAGTLVSEEDNTYLSPSFTAFYTKPFKAGKRLTVSPEIYIISTPLIYSSKDQITTTDRTFSGFLGSGFDYQLTKRFKFNVNYKANVSTNPEFPILSFLLIGSKINL